MKHLIIIGARGWGREVYAGAIGTKAYRDREFDIKGFLDSKADAFDGLKGNYPPIICAPEDYEIQPDDVFFVAMGEPQWRKHYAELMEQKGAEFLTIIEDTAYINPTATIGNGVYVSGGVYVSDNVKIGNHVMIHRLCTFGHDATIDEYTSIGAYVFLGGYAHVGKCSNMAPQSMIIRHKCIGDNVIVGSGSVVIRNYNDNLHLFVNPAKKIEF